MQLVNEQQQKAKINTPDDYWKERQEDFQLARDLDKGRKAMIKAEVKYLPKEPKEKPKAYEVRLHRTDFYPGFSECLDDLTGAVFKRDIMLGEDATEEQKKFLENVDLEGNNLSVFAKSLFRNAEKYSIAYFLVEFPNVQKGINLAQERKMGARPYWREVEAPDIIFMASRVVNGERRLVDLRIQEMVTIPDGFGLKKTQQIRRYVQKFDAQGQPERVDWEVYKKKPDKDEYEEIPTGGTGTLNPVKRIPLVPVYTKRDGFMRGKWRLEHCAWLNVMHWQSSSDQRNILRVVRCPILAHAGFYKDTDKDITISPNTHQGTTRPEAKMWYVEHSGQAIEAGANDLERLKGEMQQTGKKMAIKKTGSITATEAGINTAQSQSELQSDSKSLKDALENGYALNAEWVGSKDPAPSIIVNTDFGILEADSGNNKLLLESTQAGKLSTRTYLQEVKRRNLLEETLDVHEELEQIKIEQALNWLGNSAGEDEEGEGGEE